MLKSKRSLKDVVGKKTYRVWTDMLRELVPGGRTHRLAPIVAAMLQYSVKLALEQCDGQPAKAEEGSTAYSLLVAEECHEMERVLSEIEDVTKRLFDDAGVSYERYNARGDQYSIIEQACFDFINWYEMPWNS